MRKLLLIDSSDSNGRFLLLNFELVEPPEKTVSIKVYTTNKKRISKVSVYNIIYYINKAFSNNPYMNFTNSVTINEGSLDDSGEALIRYKYKLMGRKRFEYHFNVDDELLDMLYILILKK